MIFENLKLNYFYQIFSPFKESEVSNIISLVSPSRIGRCMRFKCYGNASFNEEDTKHKFVTIKELNSFERKKSNVVVFEVIDEDTEIDGNEKYNIIEYNVQDLFSIIDNEIIAYRIIMYILHDLYINIFKHSIKEDYQDNSLDNIKNVIHTMYSAILTSKQDKILPNTVFHYIVNKISEIDNLNKNNLYSISKIAEQIINV